MLFLLIAICLSIGLASCLRSALTPEGQIIFSGFNGVGVVAAFVAFAAVGFLFGFTVAACTLLSLFIYELGQMLARRSLGVKQAELRLLPLPFLSRTKAPHLGDDPLGDCYVALMGAGLSLAPLALAFTASQLLVPYNHELATLALTFAVTCGAVNFIMLLPFVPLDGGHCVRVFAYSFWPAIGPAITCFMIAVFASASLKDGSVAFMVLAAIGLQSLLPRRFKVQRPLAPNDALTVLAAYSFTLAAHFCGGWWLIQTLI